MCIKSAPAQPLFSVSFLRSNFSKTAERNAMLCVRVSIILRSSSLCLERHVTAVANLRLKLISDARALAAVVLFLSLASCVALLQLSGAEYFLFILISVVVSNKKK